MRSVLFLTSALMANAFIIDIFETNTDAKCLEVGAVCKTTNGVLGPCCKNSHCPDPVVDISHCTLNIAPVSDEMDYGTDKKRCLRPGAWCAGISGPVGKCCKGTRCVYESPDNAHCRGPKKVIIEVDVAIKDPKPEADVAAKCLAAGSTCSGIAGPTGTCCSGLRCVNESPDHGVCRGPKRLGLISQTESDLAETKCLRAGAACAGIAGPSGSCCPPTKCVYDSPDHATCRGIKLEDQFETAASPGCIKNGATCASENGRFMPCCEGWQCVGDNPYEPEHGACYKKK